MCRESTLSKSYSWTACSWARTTLMAAFLSSSTEAVRVLQAASTIEISAVCRENHSGSTLHMDLLQIGKVKFTAQHEGCIPNRSRFARVELPRKYAILACGEKHVKG